jgi:hypothetical protein
MHSTAGKSRSVERLEQALASYLYTICQKQRVFKQDMGRCAGIGDEADCTSYLARDRTEAVHTHAAGVFRAGCTAFTADW